MLSVAQSEFELWVYHAVAEELKNSHVDFSTLTATLPGIYPQEVLRALHVLDRQHLRLKSEPAILISSASNNGATPRYPSGQSGLPPPHPLDFEWRFAPTSISVLVKNVNTLAPPGGQLALVGTPTFATTKSSLLDKLDIDYYGLDADALFKLKSTAHIREFYTTNLLVEPNTDERYDVLVMDPPWYDEYVLRFLYFAATHLNNGGHLLIAMPASGTRPGIINENNQVRAWAQYLGFILINIECGALPYETPPFERNALRACGILNIGEEWRRGDLWIFRKNSSPSLSWPGNIFRSSWQEFQFDTVRVRVNMNAENAGRSLLLRSITEGDVLSSVSRRDERRTKARVWTTGNRVFACDAPLAFATALKAWQEHKKFKDWHHDEEQKARDQFFAIVEQERIEIAWPNGMEIDFRTY